MGLDLQSYWATRTIQVEQALDTLVPVREGYPATIYEAMRYSLFAGGKRLRPILVLATVETLGGDPQRAMPIACALEMIHTYSLIHDDLPAMDDDDYRRGKLTNHKVFGEAIAILAGDALLTHAFEVLTRLSDVVDPTQTVQIIQEIAVASGTAGMIGGQVADMLSENGSGSADTLAFIHRHKTGALLRASVRSGAIFSRADDDTLRHLTQYSEFIGLAFQIKDDVLDVVGEAQKLGKSVGADAAHGKLTYPAIHGLEESQRMVERLTSEAFNELQQIHRDTTILRAIAEFLVERDR